MKHQDVNVQVVNIVGSQQKFSWFGALLLVGLFAWLWKPFLLAAVLLIIVAMCVSAYQERQRERKAILQRADQQNSWVMKGDPRGMYGDWER